MCSKYISNIDLKELGIDDDENTSNGHDLDDKKHPFELDDVIDIEIPKNIEEQFHKKCLNVKEVRINSQWFNNDRYRHSIDENYFLVMNIMCKYCKYFVFNSLFSPIFSNINYNQKIKNECDIKKIKNRS